MKSLPQELYRAEQVRELDRIAIEDRGIDGYELMTRAGQAAFRVMLERWPRARRISILCGTGNNGGDGYVVATQARRAGLEAQLWTVAPPKSQAAIQACRDYEAAGGEIQDLANASEFNADVVVDALLGTGLEREVTGDYARIIDAINTHPGAVLAIDIPSGLNADTGRVLGTAVRADATVTFIGMKLGLFTGRGQVLAGAVLFDDLDVPADIYSELVPAARRIRPNRDLLAGLARPRDAHKGDCGRVVVIGGDTGMLGALQMCGVAAYRSGAGLVRVITRPEHAVAVTSGCPELLVTGSDDPAAVKRQLTDADAVAIGPGLGQGEWGNAMLSLALEWPGPLVIDADALNLLAADPVSREQWILTPHPGEAGRLLASGSAKVQSDRVAAVRETACRFGGVAVLKGSGTLVSGADDRLWVCDIGNPGMAVGGMGDVLTGVIVSLVAQGMPLSSAACLGVWLHAAAADHAAEDIGEIGLMATDLYPWLSAILSELLA